jgi:hypothetical protein
MNSQENSYAPPVGPSRRVQKLQAQRVAHLEQVTDVSKKVLGYVRVSTEEQASKGHGLGAQERAIRAFADSQGFELIGIETDGGVSGARNHPSVTDSVAYSDWPKPAFTRPYWCGSSTVWLETFSTVSRP